MKILLSKKARGNERLCVWHITESVKELMKIRQVSKEDLSLLNSFTHDNRKKEWLVSRILVEELTGKKNIQIIYDEHNKPFLKNPEKHISLSHSHNLLAVIMDDKETGIDIELIRQNIVRIKEKFMSDAELKSLGKEHNTEQLTIYWCAKESLYKLYGKKNLSFKKNLIVKPFEYREEGSIIAEIITETMQQKYMLQYEKISVDEKNYMLAYIIHKD